VIDLSGQKLIQHIHRRSEQNPLIALASAPAHDLGKECFSHAGIANEHQVRTSLKEREIKQPQDAVFVLLAGLMVLKVEGVDTGLCLQARVFKAAFEARQDKLASIPYPE